MPADPPADAQDATRRTRLAVERTYLAWWRTGLAALAVGLAAGELVPELTESDAWPFQVVGSGFCVVGIALIVLGLRRAREVDDALGRGDYAPLGDRLAFWLTVAGVALGLATVALVLFAG